jgi:hypothetical protein
MRLARVPGRALSGSSEYGFREGKWRWSCHNHLGGGKDALSPEKIRHYLEEIEAAGIRTIMILRPVAI